MLIDGCQLGARCLLNLDWGSKSHRHLDIPTPPDTLVPSVYYHNLDKVGATFNLLEPRIFLTCAMLNCNWDSGYHQHP